jgi:hypothetical protein
VLLGAYLFLAPWIVVALLSTSSHGAHFGRRLVELAKARKEAEDSDEARMLALRRQRLSFGISTLNVPISVAVVILATYARAG